MRLFIVIAGVFALVGLIAVVALLILWLTRKGRDDDRSRFEDGR